MAEHNEAIVRRLAEAIDKGNLDAVDELVVRDFIDHTAAAEQPPGREGIKRLARVFQDAFPGWNTEIEGMIAEGDTPQTGISGRARICPVCACARSSTRKPC
jgi:predicted SnoaL-like aldol condensation-catalyzing enzyme